MVQLNVTILSQKIDLHIDVKEGIFRYMFACVVADASVVYQRIKKFKEIM